MPKNKTYMKKQASKNVSKFSMENVCLFTGGYTQLHITKMSFSLSSQTWTNGVLVKLHNKQGRDCKRYWNYGLMSYLSMVFFKTVHYWCNRYLMTNYMQK